MLYLLPEAQTIVGQALSGKKNALGNFLARILQKMISCVTVIIIKNIYWVISVWVIIGFRLKI